MGGDKKGENGSIEVKGKRGGGGSKGTGIVNEGDRKYSKA